MPALIVERVGPLVTLQDAGRRGFAHEGVPPSGPLDPEAFELAIAAASTDVAIEVPLSSARFFVEGEALVSIDGETPRIVSGPLELPACARAVRYLAVRGGFDVPTVLGSRATLASAQLGGFAGRALRRGDRVPIGEPTDRAPRFGRSVRDPDDEPIDVLPVDALDRALEAEPFTVDPRSDRIGTRLSGGALAGRAADALSRPLVPGAIQLPPDGRPIVIGPDGPTTGGYVVIGVLPTRSRARLARVRPGGVVRFRYT